MPGAEEAGDIGAELKLGGIKCPKGSGSGLASRRLVDGESTGLSLRLGKDDDDVPTIGKETERCIGPAEAEKGWLGLGTP